MAKINPNFSNFFSNAAAAGFGSNEIISFMQNVFSNPSANAEKSRLHKGASQGSLRPDELESLQEIHRSEAPERVLKGAAKAAGTLGGIGLAAGKLPDLLKTGAGILNSLQGKKNPTQEPQEEPQQEKPMGFEEFIRQYPELGNFLDDQILSKGVTPTQAATEARNKRLFKPIIGKIEGDIGQSFEDILNQFFQGKQKTQQEQPQNPTRQGMSTADKQARIVELIQQRMGKR